MPGASHMNDVYRAAFFTQLGLPSLIGLHRHLNRA
jgi:RNA-directed DNA polymerase